MKVTETTYNGWKNYETWNVNLWLVNDEGLYSLVTSSSAKNYRAFIESVSDILGTETPDGVAWLDENLDYEALDEALEEM